MPPPTRGCVPEFERVATALLVLITVELQWEFLLGITMYYWDCGTQQFTLLLLVCCIITAAGRGNGPPAYFSA